jgi:hypothetical protein
MNNRERVELQIAINLLKGEREGRATPNHFTLALESLQSLASTDGVDNEERNFRWAYRAVAEVAKDELARMNAERTEPNDWPAGQTWEQINGTSRSICMRRARARLGIPDDEFLAGIRDGSYNVEDLYE